MVWKWLFVLMPALAGCSQLLPGVLSTIDDLATQEAVGVTIDKTAIQSGTDVKVFVEIDKGS